MQRGRRRDKCCSDPIEAIEQAANVKGGKTWLVNPGTVVGLAAPATWWIAADLEAMHFEIQNL